MDELSGRCPSSRSPLLNAVPQRGGGGALRYGMDIYSGASKWNSFKADTKNIYLYEIFKYHKKKKMLTFWNSTSSMYLSLLII